MSWHPPVPPATPGSDRPGCCYCARLSWLTTKIGLFHQLALLHFTWFAFLSCRGSLNNYVDRILQFFDHPHAWTVFIPWARTKKDIFDPFQTSSCLRSYWMAPSLANWVERWMISVHIFYSHHDNHAQCRKGIQLWIGRILLSLFEFISNKVKQVGLSKSSFISWCVRSKNVGHHLWTFPKGISK